jgi:hypothetical protein
LDFNGEIHCVDDAAEFDNCAVACALDDPAVMHRDGRINKVASERPQPRQNPVLVGSRKPRIADDVGHQDRGELPSLAHSRPLRTPSKSTICRFARSGARLLLREAGKVA